MEFSSKTRNHDTIEPLRLLPEKTTKMPSECDEDVSIVRAQSTTDIDDLSMGQKRRRRRKERHVPELSKAERKEVNPTLRSLLLPWILLAGVAVCFMFFRHAGADADPIDEYFNYEVQDPSVSSSFERLLESSQEGALSSQFHRLLRKHHPPLLPLDKSDYVGFFFAILGLMIAAGGGIGGGGILVPVYCLILGFSPKHAIPLSNVTVLGGAVANTYLNAKKRHPLADRPLVDWDLILVMEPLTVAGALMGAFLNKLLPEAVLTVMLVVLLSFTAYTSLKKGVKMYKIESKHLREQGYRDDGTKESELTRMAHSQDGGDDAAAERLLDDAGMQDSDEADEDKRTTTDDNDHDEENDTMKDIEINETEESRKAQLEQILEEEREVPKMNINILVAMFVVVLLINMVKGGGAFPSPLGIKCGSTSFWLANGAMLAWIIIVSLFVRAYLVNRWRIKQRVGYRYAEGDIKWDPRATIVYPCVCCLAGFFAGMFGVGGGIVKGPLMLAMGVHPAVSSASSACMILFTSFTATTSFVVFGLLRMDYAWVCFFTGFFATLVGQVGLSYLMKKYQRNSYIVFSIGAVVLLSAFLMTIQSLLAAAEGGEKEKSGGVCGHD